MQQTTNCNLNLIEKTDEIISSISGINDNFKVLDTILGDVETVLETVTTGNGV